MDFEKGHFIFGKEKNSKATDCKIYMNHSEWFLGLSGLKCIFSHFVINGIIPTTMH
jgi:hypothetical protein